MSVRVSNSSSNDVSTKRNKKWAVFMGDCALFREALSKMRRSKRRLVFWNLIGIIDALARGVGQVVFANNPISGILIAISLCINVPYVALFGVITGLLGLLVSMLIQSSAHTVENGLSVYNPLLIGAVTSALLPNQCQSGDGLTLLLIFVATIFSVFLTRASGIGTYSTITIPFNIAEIMILLVLKISNIKNSTGDVISAASNFDCPSGNVTEATSSISNDTVAICKSDNFNVTSNVDWGMVLRGIVVSSSQVFAVDSVIAASVIYLSILIYSPTSAIFCLIGAIIGTLSALGLGIPYESIYAGIWGYNSLLSSCALGGIFIVLNAQTVPLAFIVATFTVLLQYVLHYFFSSMELSVLTIPFVITTVLFITLRDAPDDAYPKPSVITFPEEQRAAFLVEKDSSNEDLENPNV